MYKRKIAEKDRIVDSPGKRLRQHLGDLTLRNEISYTEAGSLYKDAVLAGAAHCRDMFLQSSQKNMARDMKRRLMRGNPWPKPYHAAVRCWNFRTRTMERKRIPFLLPHEVLGAFCSVPTNLPKLLETEGLDYEGRQHLSTVREAVRTQDIVPLGFWGDGVPVNYDRSESCDCYSFNFPGMTNEGRKLRIPFTCMLKRHNMTPETSDDIMSIFAWSLKCCLAGRYPLARHDNSAWLPQDAARKKLAGQRIGLQAVLLEIRGDWCFFKSIFSLPGWKARPLKQGRPPSAGGLLEYSNANFL